MNLVPFSISEASTSNQVDRASFTFGLIADTHIPDQVNQLHPEIAPFFQSNGVSHILHAGDICGKRVLAELGQIAPVTAVRGNRDLFAGPLPMLVAIERNGVRIALTHGHSSFTAYLIDKVFYFIQGYRLQRYLKYLTQAGGNAHVIVFGHTHYPEIAWNQGRMIFNPGSASRGYRPGDLPSIGLLRIDPSGQFQAEIIRLPGWKIQKHHWVKT